MDKIPESAAVNESVKLTKTNKCGYASGLVNAVLRKISKNGLVLKNDLPELQKLSVSFSIPEDTVNFLLYHYGKVNTEAFLKASLEPKEIFIRVNTVKTTTEKLKELLIEENVKVILL